jgi:hypothetical protein
MSTLRERFRAKIFKSGECWLFTGYCNQEGYGRIKVQGRLRQASHVAWFLKYGVWPTKQLNHTCDNPACIKIGHMYEGTQKENIADMLARGRESRMIKHIVEFEGERLTWRQLSERLGVTRGALDRRRQLGQSLTRARFTRA